MTSKPQSHGMEQNQDGSSSKQEIRICWTLAKPNRRFLGKVRKLEKVQFYDRNRYKESAYQVIRVPIML